MKIEEIQKDWLKRGFSGGLWVDPLGQVWENYIHDADELFMVVSGDVELEMKGKKVHLKTGEEVLIPARVCHSVRNIGSGESQWLYAYKNRKGE